MTVVLDASAILAYLQDEPGADLVEAQLSNDAQCGAANWSEIAQKVLAGGRDWGLVKALLNSYGIQIEPVLGIDAGWAANRWTKGESLSLGERLCFSLGDHLDCVVLTADKNWGTSGRVSQTH